MAGVALVVFREVLEAALVISLVCAATRGVRRRGRFVMAGVGLGLAGAVLVALGAGVIADWAQGAGQGVFDAAVLLAATAMIGWHVIWMSAHGRQLAVEMRALGGAVKSGSRSLTMLAAVIALAVLREGSEVVLFLDGMAAGGAGVVDLTAGIAAGTAGGAALGMVLYLGLLKIPLRHFFRFTNGLLMLLAAGLAASAAGFLVQSDWLPPLGSRIWDTSGVLRDDSLAGRMLGILIGYRASPAGIQVLFYVTTLMVLWAAVRWQARLGRSVAGAG